MSDDHLEYTNRTYERWLLASVWILIVFNCYLLFQGNYLTLIPLFLQGAIISVHALKWSEQRILIRFWSGIWILAGSAGLVSSCAQAVAGIIPEETTTTMLLGSIAVYIAEVAGGLYFMIMLPRSTRVVVDESIPSNDSPHAS